MTDAPNETPMVKSERKHLVLEFMSEHPLALPPVWIYRNMRILKSIRVGNETVKNYLNELVEEGYVMRVDKQALDDAEIIEADEDSRACYIITEAGKDHVES